jgi:hypothetical protein
MLKTFRKYGVDIPEGLIFAVDTKKVSQASADTGSDPAVPNDAYDSAYLSPVTIGDNTVHLDFDTGSADL